MKAATKESIIRNILADVRKAWLDIIETIAPNALETNFPLTSFTPHCFLDPHNDLGNGSNAYCVTLLLYLGSEFADTGGLVFNYNGQKKTIKPYQNRSILFVLMPETEHWIERVPEDVSPRLALSWGGL